MVRIAPIRWRRAILAALALTSLAVLPACKPSIITAGLSASANMSGATTPDGVIVTSINASPADGPIAAGTVITLTGSGFTSDLQVTVNGVSCAPVVVPSSILLTCTATAAIPAGGPIIIITKSSSSSSGTSGSSGSSSGSGSGGGGGSGAGAPTVTLASPNNGAITGGNLVTIAGTAFVSGAAVKFGSTASSSVTFISATELRATAPAVAASTVNVVVTNPDGQAGTLTNGYTYNQPPTLTSVNPSQGLTEGGTLVTFTGTGFLSGVTASIGGAACTNPRRNSATELTCRTPIGTAGLQSATVTNTDGQSSSALANAFDYKYAPAVVSGLQAWYKADAITGVGSGSNLVTWIDSSTNARHAVQGTGGNQPTYQTNQINGKPVVQFAGAHFLAAPNPSISPASMAFYIVLKVNSLASNGDIFNLQTAGASHLWYYTTGNLAHGNTGNPWGAWPALLSTTGYHLIEIIAPNTASNDTRLYYDGRYLGGIASGSSAAWNTIRLGGAGWASSANISLAEVALYNSNPTEADRISIEDYLIAKYALLKPRLSHVTPFRGSATGGETVTIQGWNLRQGATVTIGGSTCASPEPLDSHRISCVTPALAAGSDYAVVLTNSDGQSATLPKGYSVSPNVLSSPPQKTGLALWFHANALAHLNNGDLVDSWPDSSFNTRDPNNLAVLARRPTFVTNAYNGLPAVRFDGAGNSLDTGAGVYSLAPTSYTAFAVARRVSANNATVFALNSGTAHALWNYLDGSLSFGDASQAGEWAQIRASWTETSTTQAHLITLEAQQTAANRSVSVYKNGQFIGVGGNNVDLSPAFNQVAIGSFGGANYPWNGDISEIIIFTPKLSLADRVDVENYLNYKYQLYPPRIRSVEPASSGVAGGSAITIRGTGFMTGATAKVDGASCATTTFIDPTTLVCSSAPAHTAARVDIAVTNPDNKTSTLPASYLYHSGSGGTVLPTDVAGLQIWLRADAAAAQNGPTGSTVMSWTDSVNAISLSESYYLTGRPTIQEVVQNGVTHPSVRFDGTDDALGDVSTAITGSPGFTTVLVAKRGTAGGGGGYGIPFQLASGPDSMYAYNTGQIFFGNASNVYSRVATPWSSTSAPEIYVISVPTAGLNSTINFYRNGVPLGRGDNVAHTNGAWNQIAVGGGGYSTFNSYFGGDILDLAVYNQELTATNRAEVENYFNAKYKLYNPGIASVSPCGGSTAGGDTVTVRGYGFQRGATVKIDGTACATTTWQSPFSVVCSTAPAHAGGWVSVAVSNPDTLTGTLDDGYRYLTGGQSCANLLGGLQAWYQSTVLGATGVANNGLIYTWPDSSSNERDAFANYNAQPTYLTNLVNTRPVARFSGTKILQPLSFGAVTVNEMTAFVVAKRPAATNYIFGFGANTSIWSYASGDLAFGNPASAGHWGAWSGVWASAATYDIFAIKVGTTGSQLSATLYFNGGSASTINSITTNTSWSQLVLGAGAGLNSPWGGDIVEIIVYNAALTDADRQALRDALNAKYNSF